MSDWNVEQINQLGRVVTGKTPPKTRAEYYEGNELFVSPKDFDWNGGYVDKTQTTISLKALEAFKNQVLPQNAVLFTSLSYGFGKMAIASRRLLTNQQINSVIANDEHHFRFIYYLLRAYTPIIFSYNSGIDTPIVPKSVFEKVQVRCPELKLQRKIAAILTAYDDLIEANKRRIALLEKMAEELYREWFVRMRFPGHQNTKFVKGVPEGWEIRPLSDLGTFLNGFAFKPSHWGVEGIPIIKIKEMNNGVTGETPRNLGDDISSKYHFDDGAIIFSWSGTLLVMVWDQGPGLLNQHLFKVDPKQGIPHSFLFLALSFSVPLFEALTTGATMQHIKRKELSFVKVKVPPSHLLKNFNNLVEPVLEAKLQLTRVNRTLAQTRDLLLPRLISGKLSVEDLDIQFPPSMQEASTVPEVAHA